ncbi:NAD-dependent epimerase/dehydratase family protein [Acinetobacter sichuanensis]|uniref:NAD-dependent epimerase/dehydratase family protein n=1 Tax=Acinetobacter sichuanensis TaxID=2136183 RepID=UPI0028106373|nr:NAD-dependent epimerase/dehydratase family protein [Acinetobacter sichuanensis]MDQ9021864.1 NAD-dependent epimerase/dehydratase family protein [Acinetobacter sichuanensis]
MSHIVITGANGFLGKILLNKLLKRPDVTKITLTDQQFKHPKMHAKLVYKTGDITQTSFIAELCHDQIDVFYHLASMPGAAAEQQPHLAQKINYQSVQLILNQLELQKSPPKFIFASSIAVYGHDKQKIISECDYPNPRSLYATHKAMVELMIADASRRKIVEGYSLRVPGLVARPEKSSGFASSFMSEIFWALKNDEKIILPVSQQATAWWLSADCAAENFIFVAFNTMDCINHQRTIQLPVLYLSIQELIDGISDFFEQDKSALISYQVDPFIQENFGSYPPLMSTYSESKGFFNDQNIKALIQRVYQ